MGKSWQRGASATCGVLALITLAISAVAQDAPPALWHDVTLADPSRRALDHFHRALAHANERKVRVVVFGDSHTAAFVLPNTLTAALQARYGSGGAGFIFPARPWPGYRPTGVEQRLRSRFETRRINSRSREAEVLGHAGVALVAASADVASETRFTTRSAARHIELFTYAHDGGGTLTASTDGTVRATITTADARPHVQVTRIDTAAGVRALELRTTDDREVRVLGMSVESAEHGVVVDALGINGARARNQRLWEETSFREALALRAPSLLIFQYGTNEAGDDTRSMAREEADLRAVITRAKSAAPNASCVLVGPTDRPLRVRADTYEDRPRTLAISEVQRRIAAELGCGFFDTLAFQGGPMAMVQWVLADPPLGEPDHVHLTPLGYERLGVSLAAALMPAPRR